MLLPTVAVTVAALLASVVLTLAGQGVPAAVAHLAFAVGIVPLIFAAMSHFVPVLTHSGQPAKLVRLFPPAAQVAGILACGAMQGLAPRWLLHAAAGLDFLLAAGLLAWMFRRARACLGRPHPGWRWYAAALVCLLAALAAVPPLLARPELYAALRGWHLHLNTLGLVGLAALGTLPVLLPTALGRPDPAAAGWLRRRLWPLMAGVLVVALGAALASGALAAAGALLFLWPLFGLLAHWRQVFGAAAIRRDGAATALAAASAGLALLILAGVAHGAGLIPARPAIAAWAAGFLLPLVSGAVSQLLPVWRWPGPVTPQRLAMRERLVAGGQLRAAFFLAAEIALLGESDFAAGLLAAGGLLLFVGALIRAMRFALPAR